MEQAGQVTHGTRTSSQIQSVFTDNLHRRGMKVTLNDHPADGVRAFEDVYPEFAAYMGVDQERASLF